MHLERATLQWFVQSHQRRTLRRAVSQAYVGFARLYPECVAALFDAHFVKRHVLPEIMRAATEGDSVTAAHIAEVWARQLATSPALRQTHIAAITPAAADFLCMVIEEFAALKIGHNPNALAHISNAGTAHF